MKPNELCLRKVWVGDLEPGDGFLYNDVVHMVVGNDIMKDREGVIVVNLVDNFLSEFEEFVDVIPVELDFNWRFV